MNKGMADQNPMTLCQLKSRAFPLRVGLNHKELRNELNDHFRGHHRYRPLTTRPRNARLHAPVTARATSRFWPCAPNHRCQSVTTRKNFLTPCEPSPTTCPVCRSRNSDASRPNENSIAVSYTHLRAHETPEHLVCRL